MFSISESLIDLFIFSVEFLEKLGLFIVNQELFYVASFTPFISSISYLCSPQQTLKYATCSSFAVL